MLKLVAPTGHQADVVKEEFLGGAGPSKMGEYLHLYWEWRKNWAELCRGSDSERSETGQAKGPLRPYLAPGSCTRRHGVREAGRQLQVIATGLGRSSLG